MGKDSVPLKTWGAVFSINQAFCVSPFTSRSHTVDGAGCGEEQRGDEQVSVHPSQGQLCLLDYGQLVSLSLRSGFSKAPSGKMCVFLVRLWTLD